MCECLKLPMGFYLEKRVEAKQSDLSAKERAKIGKYMAYVGPNSLKNKKILLVDDVYTTGSTAKSCLDLLLERHPKKLALLVMSRGVMK